LLLPKKPFRPKIPILGQSSKKVAFFGVFFDGFFGKKVNI
jgi:hypothetical protein